MSLKKILFVAVTTLVVFSGFALPCQAQSPLKRHRPLRWLGHGFSDGYHRHNPGHDTSYYNPYSAHNSALVSQHPEYQSILAQQANQNQTQRFFAGVPFSVYAAPNQLTPGIHNLPGQQVEGSFSPSVGSGLLNEDDQDKASDNSFQLRDDDDFRDDEDDDFRDDDDAFRNDDDDAFRDDPMDEEDSMEDTDALDRDDVENLDVDTSNLGGLSGLNDSLSFDFD